MKSPFYDVADEEYEVEQLPTHTFLDEILPMFRGNYYLLAGMSGVGKSTLSYYLASKLAVGYETFYLSTEITGNLARAIAVKRFPDINYVKFFKPEYTDLSKLKEVVYRKRPDFLIIDVIDDLPGYTDISKTPGICLELCDIAQQANCVVLGIHHLAKAATGTLTMTSLKGSSSVYQKPSGILGYYQDAAGERIVKLLKKSRIPCEHNCSEGFLTLDDGEYTLEAL